MSGIGRWRAPGRAMRGIGRWRAPGRAAGAVAAAACLAAGLATSQTRTFSVGSDMLPEAEFHLARMVYDSGGRGGGSRGFRMPMWAIDYPAAEEHFLPALERVTRLSVAPADEPRHIQLTDDVLFDYPYLFMQQPGAGYWRPSEREVERLREYLQRGGFLVIDDFHGNSEWITVETAMQRVLPGRPIIEIPETDPLFNILYGLDKSTQIPGERHLRRGMEGPPHWRGIYDDEGRLMVAINFNIDMGDAWEHADDPGYPLPMTSLAYRFGTNYVIYAMTH